MDVVDDGVSPLWVQENHMEEEFGSSNNIELDVERILAKTTHIKLSDARVLRFLRQGTGKQKLINISNSQKILNIRQDYVQKTVTVRNKQHHPQRCTLHSTYSIKEPVSFSE